jgi:hypothetical protein
VFAPERMNPELSGQVLCGFRVARVGHQHAARPRPIGRKCVGKRLDLRLLHFGVGRLLFDSNRPFNALSQRPNVDAAVVGSKVICDA